MTIHESIKSRVKVRNVKRGKEGTEIRIYEKMSELRHSDYSKKANIKIVRDEHGEMIKTAQGNTTLKFLQTTSNASSSAVDNDQMPCNTATTTTQDNWSEGLGRLLAACELAFSLSDSSDEEIQHIWLLKDRKKPRIKHYITNVVDQLNEEEVFVYN
ncbi:uncharacterized protein [Temnothorax nylanderi]|uniref:uncharacterized protein n=1 Tax=Temnothorax nylanderi TaxID=102681 RepID=UPI003A8A1AC3